MTNVHLPTHTLPVPTSSHHTHPPLIPPLHTPFLPPTTHILSSSSHNTHPSYLLPPHISSPPHPTTHILPTHTLSPFLPPATPTLREVITSGTVVTYNDRQQILCQKCTDFALDEVDNGQHQPGSVRGSKSVEREVRCVCECVRVCACVCVCVRVCACMCLECHGSVAGNTFGCKWVNITEILGMVNNAHFHNVCFEESHVYFLSSLFLLRALQHETASVKLVPTLPLAILPPLLPPKKIFLTSLKFQMLTHSLDLAWEVRELLRLSALLFFLPPFILLPPSSLPPSPTYFPFFLYFPLPLFLCLLPSLVDRFTYHTHSHRVCRVWSANPNHPVTACPGPSLAPLLLLLFSLPQATHLRVHEQVRQAYPP